jgi:hypothetical protein
VSCGGGSTCDLRCSGDPTAHVVTGTGSCQ